MDRTSSDINCISATDAPEPSKDHSDKARVFCDLLRSMLIKKINSDLVNLRCIPYPKGRTNSVCGLTRRVIGFSFPYNATGTRNSPKVVDIFPQLPSIQIYLYAIV